MMRATPSIQCIAAAALVSAAAFVRAQNPEPIGPFVIGNKGVEEKDSRGRPRLWGEEKDNVVPAAPRGGAFHFDETVRHEGHRSVVLAPRASDGWYGISTVNYPVPASRGRLRLSGWLRCEPGAQGQIAACWMDDRPRAVRTDLSESNRSADWRKVSLVADPPAEATTVRLVAVARGGKVWVDDFDVQLEAPNRRVVRVFVNQVGYNLTAPKSAVVATNFLPSQARALAFELHERNGTIVDRRQLASARRINPGTSDDWGLYFWRADFSSFEKPGTYTAAATAILEGGQTAHCESPPFAIKADCLLAETAPAGVDFFFVQRCGFDVPGWHRACHLDDARLPDGTHIDATGGWHSAGDYNKPMWQFGDSAAVYALSALYDEHRAALERFDRDRDGVPDALDEAAWGAKFLAKMQNPADGSLRGDVNQGPGRTWMRWKAPDVHTDNKFGTADDPVIAQPVGNTPLAIAGWARLAPLLKDRSAASDYLARADRLWTYYTRTKNATGNSLLIFGSVELHAATGRPRYKQFADTAVDAVLQAQRPDGGYPGDSGDHGDWAAAALATYVLRYPHDSRGDRVRQSLKKYLEFCLSRADNPFGLSRQGVGSANPPYFHPSVGLGVNFWLLGRAWAAALIYRVNRDRRALVYATDQIDWVFGKNPYGLCMFEGKGTNNPPRYHHRYNTLPGHERGAVPGAIPNGFVTELGLADRPGFDMSHGGGKSPSHRTSEPWLVHNIAHLLAVSSLPADHSGGPGR